MKNQVNTESGYKIGAVSRLTGVPADTLRVWERRYNTVEPERTEGGNRLYSRSDIDRLSVIKLLVDNGHAIGTVANLSIEQLQERAENNQQGLLRQENLQPTGPVNIVVIGPTLAYRLEPDLAAENDEQIHVAGLYTSVEQFEQVVGSSEVDILIFESPTLKAGSAKEVRRLQRLCNAGRSVVIYGFGARESAQALEERGISTLRFPVSWEMIRLTCCPRDARGTGHPVISDLNSLLHESTPRRLYTDEQLARVSNASVAIRCECPHHLADLVMSLSRFEQYSEECENLSREDAALHTYLHKTTAKSRVMMEEALARLVELEGIDIDSFGK